MQLMGSRSRSSASISCPDASSRRLPWSLLLLILLATTVVYWPTLDHELQYDAKLKLLKNPDLAEPMVYFKAFAEPEYNEKASRLIANLTFCLDYHLYGWDPFGYHLTNLLIHLVNVLLLALLGRQLAMRGGVESSMIPIIAAGVFALHPLNSEAVNYCNARPNLVATGFYVLTLVLLLRVTDTSGKKRSLVKRIGIWLAIAVTLCCALLSKELAATVVVMAPLMILWLEESRQRRRQILRRAWLVLVVLLVVGVSAMIATRAHTEVGLNLFQYGELLTGSWILTLILTVLGQGQVLVHYFALALLPLPCFLNVDHYQAHLHQLIAGPEGAASTALLLPGAATLGIVMMVVTALIIRHRYRLASFLMLWPLITHAPTSLVPRGEAFVEYRTYLPMVGVSLLIAWLLAHGLRLVSRRFRAPKPIVVGLILMTALAAGTVTRNRVWQTEISLWQDVLEKTPHNPRAHNNLGVALQAEGAHDAAISLFQRALELDPDYADAHSNLGHALALQGELDRAIIHLRRSLELYPIGAEAHTNLGNALSAIGDYDGAVFHYLSALAYKPHLDDAHFNLGQVLVRQGKLAEAIAHFRSALRINPQSADTHNTLGLALAAKGRLSSARSHFEQALGIRPDFAEAHSNLGNLLAASGDTEEAIRHFERAVQIAPKYAEAHEKLADLLLSQGRAEPAIEHYQQALAVVPELDGLRAKLSQAVAIHERMRRSDE
jgi:tetratricopeptide (TPR) repeat protein